MGDLNLDAKYESIDKNDLTLQKRNRYTETLSAMLKYRTVSKSNSEKTENADEFVEYMKNRFPHIAKNCEWRDFDGGIMIKLSGKNHSGHELVLMSHYDVVPAIGEWKYPPFDGIVKGGVIHGRGSADTKSSLCAIFEAVEEIISEGIEPKNDLYILSSSREEIGGKDALLMSQYFEYNDIKPFLLLDEGGAILQNPMSIVNGNYALMAMSERAKIKIKIDGNPETIAKVVRHINRCKFAKACLSPEVGEMFLRMSKNMNNPYRALFKYQKLTKGLLVRILPKVSSEAAAMVKPSFTVKEIDGTLYCVIAATYHHNLPELTEKFLSLCRKYKITATISNSQKNIATSDNQKSLCDVKQHIKDSSEKINASDIQCKEKRPNIEVSAENIANDVQDKEKKRNTCYCGGKAETEELDLSRLDLARQCPPTDFRSKGVKLAERALRESMPGIIPTPFIIFGGTDARHFVGIADCVIRFAPLKMTSEIISTVHNENEYMLIQSIESAVCYYKKLIELWDE